MKDSPSFFIRFAVYPECRHLHSGYIFFVACDRCHARGWLIGTQIMVAMLLQSRCIPIDSIDFRSDWNLHPWELYRLGHELHASLTGVGILHPPIVIARDNHRYNIICGFKRLLFAASSEKPPQVNCHILAKDTPPASILEIVLADQCLARPLSMAEKARFLEISSAYLQHQDIVDRFCEKLQLDKRPSTFSKLLEILKQHPLFISEVHGGFLQDKIVMELLRLPEEGDRIAMVKLFKDLSIGDGKQRKFLPLIRDLAFRHNTSITEYLEDSSIQAVLSHPEMNNPQKFQHIATFLQRQTNPSSTQAESEFANRIKTLQIPENCTISHSPSFEKDEVTLSITFKNLSSCERWLPILKKNLG